MTFCKPYVGYYIPMSVIVALILDGQYGTARFQGVKHKASSTLFLYIGLHPHQPRPRAGLPYEDGAKIAIIFQLSQQRHENKNYFGNYLDVWKKNRNFAADKIRIPAITVHKIRGLSDLQN